MCKTVVRSALPFVCLLVFLFFFLAWHTCHCNYHGSILADRSFLPDFSPDWTGSVFAVVVVAK